MLRRFYILTLKKKEKKFLRSKYIEETRAGLITLKNDQEKVQQIYKRLILSIKRELNTDFTISYFYLGEVEQVLE